MIYQDQDSWNKATRRHVMVFGMSGLGKTHLANLLRQSGDWFHYSIDYRIGTRYLGEAILDNAKAEAMKVPFLRELLMNDSIYIGSNITFDNLSPVATWLGKPGDPAKGGLPIAEYTRRQALFRDAEIAALLDTAHFASRAEALYGYPHFICDTGGSICEWVDADDPNDPLMCKLAAHALPVWIEGDESHTQELIRRFDRAPKPMAYQPAFLEQAWTQYAEAHDTPEDKVDPDHFVRWTYAQALAHRQPRYQSMAKWGITLTAGEVSELKNAADFEALVADKL